MADCRREIVRKLSGSIIGGDEAALLRLGLTEHLNQHHNTDQVVTEVQRRV